MAATAADMMTTKRIAAATQQIANFMREWFFFSLATINTLQTAMATSTTTPYKTESAYADERKLVSHYDANLTYYSTDILDMLKLIGHKPPFPRLTRVLDVGCGDGRAIRQLQPLTAKDTSFTGVDYSEPRIRLAISQNTSPNVEFVYADVYSYLDHCIDEKQRFDLVVCNEVLEHMARPGLLVQKIKQVTDWCIASCPINLPYIAHLSVFPTVKDIEKTFPDFKVTPMKGHTVMEYCKK